MSINRPLSVHPSAEETHWYHDAVRVLQKARLPFLVGGAYALWKYTGMRRPTKDLDLFIQSRHLHPALKALRAAGYRTEITAPHWIAKAFYKDYLVDFIVGQANGVGQVDESWFEKAPLARMFGLTVPLVRPEDMIWGKAFVMERDRYDGADIAHLILSHGRTLNWKHLLQRFASHEQVLLAHLILFGYIYPHARRTVPRWVFNQLQQSIGKETPVEPTLRLCRGPLFSRTQYVVDVDHRGYHDARLQPYGPLTAQQILE